MVQANPDLCSVSCSFVVKGVVTNDTILHIWLE